jgi:hypothetical protein
MHSSLVSHQFLPFRSKYSPQVFNSVIVMEQNVCHHGSSLVKDCLPYVLAASMEPETPRCGTVLCIIYYYYENNSNKISDSLLHRSIYVAYSMLAVFQHSAVQL